MEPTEAIGKVEEIFDDMVADVINRFAGIDGQDTLTWEEALLFLRGVASVVSTGAKRLAAYSGVAARQIKREEQDE